MKDYPFKNNERSRRYELDLGDDTALIDYFKTDDGSIIALTHTEVPYQYENQGIGSQLVEKSLNDIQAQGCKVIPSCGFVAAYIRRHPQWKDLVAER